MRIGKSKPDLKLIECVPALPKVQGDDELAKLIRSINEMGRKSETEAVQPTEPEPPTPLAA